MPTFLEMPLDDPRLGRAHHKGPMCQKGLHPWVPENIGIVSEGSRGFGRRCRLCALETDRRNASGRKYLKYNLSIEQYDELIKKSEGRCDVCLAPTPDLHLDHDHACCPVDRTKRRAYCGDCVRGLLCERCNWALGAFKDDTTILLRAVSYLSARIDSKSSVELRCPSGPKRLLAVSKLTGDYHGITSENLLELACRDCRAIIAKEKGSKPALVLHRFNVLGILIESEVIWD